MKKTAMIIKHYTTSGYSHEETIENLEGAMTAKEYAESYDEIADWAQDDYFAILVARIFDDEDPTEVISETEVEITGEGLMGESKFVFNREEDGDGEMKMFETAEDAIEYAEKDWRHLTAKEQKRIMDDPSGKFFVGKYTTVWDNTDEAYYPAPDPDEIILDMLATETEVLDTMKWDKTIIVDSMLAAWDNLTLEDADDFCRTLEKNVNTHEGIKWDLYDRTVELAWDKTVEDFEEVYADEFQELGEMENEYKEV